MKKEDFCIECQMEIENAVNSAEICPLCWEKVQISSDANFPKLHANFPKLQLSELNPKINPLYTCGKHKKQMCIECLDELREFAIQNHEEIEFAKTPTPLYFKRCFDCKEYLYRGMCLNLVCEQYPYKELMEGALEPEKTDKERIDFSYEYDPKTPDDKQDPGSATFRIQKTCENCQFWTADHDWDYEVGGCSEIHKNLVYAKKPEDDEPLTKKDFYCKSYEVKENE